ncbi:hydroxyethylthiazole kinase [Sporosarcina sp. NPDC096371]|uniref:hydroxyethylthiazole kinase n=1 Tax=Sporosarcina sp. NPDC096371 TaxID=3364530 RepID=UPI0037F9F7C3
MDGLLQKLREEQPLVHCMTNIVVANFQANGLLALGASPVMADAVEEAAEIASVSSCTVLNIGTLKQDTVKAMLLAGKSANAHGKPVILDPVGAGATAFRKASVLEILDEVVLTLIRCNAGELAAIAGVKWQSKGVDAGQGDVDVKALAEEVAVRYHCIVAVTGAVDIVTDGNKTISITGGHPLLSKITGAGCLLSAVAGAFLAVEHENELEAVATALTFYKKVGELAAEKAAGPGDFAVQLLNALYLGRLTT